jgi:hypothetical protein
MCNFLSSSAWLSLHTATVASHKMVSKWQIHESSPDWQCGFEESERFQLQYFKSLPIEEKLRAVEEMCDVVNFFNERAAGRKNAVG